MWLAADVVAQHRAGRSGAADREGSGADGGGQAAQQRRTDKGKAPAAAVDLDMQTGGANRKEKLLGANKGTRARYQQQLGMQACRQVGQSGEKKLLSWGAFLRS